jgi:tRNA(fMet)-specific endonuclease VapC
MGELNTYLLDTNICIYIINQYPKNIIAKIDRMNHSEIKLSSITIAELEYGASKSKRRDKNREIMLEFASSFEIIPFDSKDTEIYGILRAELERRGERIGPYDMQLASQALSRDYIFVTNNIKEFQRIRELRIENWG